MRSDFLLKLAVEFEKSAAKKSALKYTEFDDGIVINGDCCEPETFEFVKKYLDGKKIQLMHTDPPYFVLGNKFQGDDTSWDTTKMDQYEIANWMKSWVKLWLPIMYKGAALYLWGGVGRPQNRPFFVFASEIENDSEMKLTIANVLTWKKKRFFGTKKNFGFAREEILYIINDEENNPRIFNIPYTDKLRGYDGFGKYKAKSPFLRTTNILDVTELFSGKIHPTEKTTKIIDIMIKASSNRGNWVIDLFGGSGSTAVSARALGRKFIVIEKDPSYYKNIVKRLKS